MQPFIKLIIQIKEKSFDQNGTYLNIKLMLIQILNRVGRNLFRRNIR